LADGITSIPCASSALTSLSRTSGSCWLAEIAYAAGLPFAPRSVWRA